MKHFQKNYSLTLSGVTAQHFIQGRVNFQQYLLREYQRLQGWNLKMVESSKLHHTHRILVSYKVNINLINMNLDIDNWEV